MTVSTTTSRVEYAGNGSTTAFSVPFYFLANGDLKVYKAGTLQTITTHYTVSGAGNPAGGTVTFGTAPALSQTVVIFRDPALTQSTDYAPNDPFPAESHEQALDRLTMIAQRLNDKLGQALLVPNDEQFSGVVPSRDARAGRYLVFDSNGNPAASSTDIETFVNRAETAAVDAEASASTAVDSASTAVGVSSTINAALASFNDSLDATIPSFEVFSGTGAQTAFSLSVIPTTEDALDVYISGVYQQKSQYSLSGSTLTFTAAPPSGTNNIEVKIAPLVAFVTTANVDYGLII